MIVTICIVAGLLLLPYVVGPIVVRSQFRHRSSPRLNEVATSELPADVREHLEAATKDLAEIGFDQVARARMDTVPDVAAFVALFVNPETRDMACASAVVRLSGEQLQSVQSSHVEFGTRWSENKEFLTSNSSEVMPFGPVRGQALVRFAGLEDIGLLYRIHQARIRCDGPVAMPWLPARGEELDYLDDGVTRWLDAQVARGNLVAVEEEATHRLTWGGAFRATWKLLPPGKQREERRTAQVAERVLKSLGITVPPPAPPASSEPLAKAHAGSAR